MKAHATVLIALLILTGGCIGPGAAATGTEDGPAGARILPGLYISNVKVSGINDTSAVIGWDTNTESDSGVEYGLNTSYGSSVNDSTLVTSHSIQLSNLAGSTEYHFRVLSRRYAGDDPAFSGDYKFITPKSPDIQPPRVFDIRIECITETLAFVLWTTDEPADGCVEYGRDAGYGNMSGDTAFMLQHNVTLANLTPDAPYHCRAVSTDPAGNTGRSEDITFRTMKAGPPQDTGMPTISDLIVAEITETTAVVTWATDELSNGTLDYGGLPDYGHHLEDPAYTLAHAFALEGLLPQTTYHFFVGATDPSGNGPNVTADMNFTTRPHLSPPVIAILSPANGTICANSTVVVRGTATDDYDIKKVELSVNSGPWAAASGLGNWSCNVTLGAGQNAIVVRATDIYRNVNTARLVLSLGGNAPAPAIEISTQRDGQTVRSDILRVVSGTVNSSSPVQTVNVTVNGRPVRVELDGNNWTARDVPLREGQNIILVQAVDTAGNNFSTQISVKYSRPEPEPGFGALLLLAAIVIGLALFRRRWT